MKTKQHILKVYPSLNAKHEWVWNIQGHTEWNWLYHVSVESAIWYLLYGRYYNYAGDTWKYRLGWGRIGCVGIPEWRWLIPRDRLHLIIGWRMVQQVFVLARMALIVWRRKQSSLHRDKPGGGGKE